MKIEKVETVYLIMGYFLGFEKFGIDVFYNRKYQKWLFDNSTDANKNIHPEFDINGFIINVKFTAFHNSIPLTENDFIDIQINRLNTFLELKNLKSMDKIKIQHFKRHLENRIIFIEKETESRNIETDKFLVEITQQQDEINKYIQSYKHSFFSSLLNKRNEDGKENVLFYGKRTLELLNRRDKKLISKENLKDRYDLLNLYNSHLNHLINHIIQLYEAINAYNDTNNTGYLTIIDIEKDKVFSSLNSIKCFSEQIKDEVIGGNKEKAIIIKTYFVSELDVLTAFLDDTIGIDIYKSPLQTDFEAVKFALKSSINLEELKFINQLNTIVVEQPETEPHDLSNTSTVGKNIIIIKEKNSEMFSNNGFELFEYILNENIKPKGTKGRKSDLIYYYWEMHKSSTQYIHQRPAPFFKWFDKEYDETTGQLKTYDNVKTHQRIKDYSTALEWFKSKNK